MKLSTSVALAVLGSLSAVKGLIIPVFESADLVNQEIQDKSIVNSIANDVKESEVAKQIADGIKDVKKNLKKSSPVLVSPTAIANVIPFSYIVVFKNGLSKKQIEFHQEIVKDAHVESVASLDESHDFISAIKSQGVESKGGIVHDFSIGDFFTGYTGYFTHDVIEMIRHLDEVAFIEMDSRVFANEAISQVGAPWGLSRVSHRESLNLGNFNQYIYDDVAGKGVTAYVIDTGVSVTHEQFEGRAKWGKTIPADDEDIDGNGHGTHCAGTIGSKDYGISKNADIVAVKVLKSNGSGTMSDVVKGVEYAANAHLAAVKEKKKGFKGSSANMSLGGGKSPALDLAVNAAVKAGLHFAVAAGNDNADACNYSPAAAENAVTVGASTLSDYRAYFSNYGECVDIFAPGLNILSTYIGSDSATATLSGTSMASPHVCGLLTYFLSLQPESSSLFSTASVSPAQLKKNIIDFATPDVLADISSDTPNLLIFNGGGKNLTTFWESSASEIEEAAKDVKDSEKTERIINGLKLNYHAVEDKLESILNKVAKEFKEELEGLNA